MNRVFVTIAPAIDALTSMYSPARRAVSAMTSSVRFPRVALSRPPTASPVLAETDSVAWLSRAASGTMARIESTKSRVWACGFRCSPAKTAGTNASSQSIGLCRISFRSTLTRNLPASDLALEGRLLPELQEPRGVHVPEQLHERGDQARPARLVAGPDAGAALAVEVLVEEDVVAPMRIALELVAGPVH